MRERKYRAWVKEKSYFLPVFELDFHAKMVGVWTCGEEDCGLCSEYLFFDEIELVEYTGLKDKNGVEIYEGDIVETVYNGEVFAGVVVYDLSEVDFKVTDGKEKYGRNFQYLAGNDENEVIGNRYENPELLKEEPTC